MEALSRLLNFRPVPGGVSADVRPRFPLLGASGLIPKFFVIPAFQLAFAPLQWGGALSLGTTGASSGPLRFCPLQMLPSGQFCGGGEV